MRGPKTLLARRCARLDKCVSAEEPLTNSGSVPNLADDPYLALTCPPAAVRSIDYRLRFALHAAVLAPSVHNTQPWRFRLHAGTEPHVDVLIDLGRELPALDPSHRQLVMSCGAALAAYEIGLRSVGLEPEVTLFPAEAQSGCIARVAVNDLRTVDTHARHLLAVLRERRSYRGPMTRQHVEQSVRRSLALAAGTCAFLDFVPPESWRVVEHLVVQAALELSESTDVDAETKTWTRLDERTLDGVPAANWQRTSEQTAGAPVVQRDFAQGRPLPGAAPQTHEEGDPLLAVLLTRGDKGIDWVESGRALLNLSLDAQSFGLALGYVNQPTEVPGLRDRLAALLQPTPEGFDVPQLVLRLGYPAQPLPPATPRRPVQAVLVGR